MIYFNGTMFVWKACSSINLRTRTWSLNFPKFRLYLKLFRKNVGRHSQKLSYLLTKVATVQTIYLYYHSPYFGRISLHKYSFTIILCKLSHNLLLLEAVGKGINHIVLWSWPQSYLIYMTTHRTTVRLNHALSSIFRTAFMLIIFLHCLLLSKF